MNRDNSIPPLIDGGIMLSYRCSNACAHCMYRCSPDRPDQWMDEGMMRRIFEALGQERYLHTVHIAGGEPTLNMDCAILAIQTARDCGISISYVETNGYYAKDIDEARARFSRFRSAGLDAVLISASPFHNVFIPFDATRNAVIAAQEIFGPGGVIVWIPEMYRQLDRLPGDRTRTLGEFLEALHLEETDIPGLYPLILHGRSVEALAFSCPHHDAEQFRDNRCAGELANTSHFHIDRFGNLFVGLCPGIIAATIDDLHPDLQPETHPTFITCRDAGPWGLMQIAEQEFGYRQREKGYVSKCHLCLDIRKHLFRTAGDRFPDIGPEDFYGK